MDREEELKATPLQKGDPSTWPTGVRQLAIGEIGLLGINAQGVLHWDGRPVKIQKGVTLSAWQAIGTGLIVAFTVVGGIGSAAQGWTAYNEWACKVGWRATVCGSSDTGQRTQDDSAPAFLSPTLLPSARPDLWLQAPR